MPIRINRALLVGLACAAGVLTGPASPPDASALAGSRTAAVAAADLPPAIRGDCWTKVQHDIQQSEHHITWQEPTAMTGASASPWRVQAAGYQATNRAHDFRTYVTPDGIRVMPRTPRGEAGLSPLWEWGLKLSAYGETLQPVAPAQLSVSGNRIEYHRGDLTEWYVNDERGLEQGFTLTAPPQPSASKVTSPITLEMAVSGGLDATLSEDGRAIEFSTPGGAPVVRYAGLLVQDGSGRALPATMETADDSLRLLVDATSATYPLTIDPLASGPNWSAESNQAGAGYGAAVAAAGDVNGDGYDDVIVGAPPTTTGSCKRDGCGSTTARPPA